MSNLSDISGSRALVGMLKEHVAEPFRSGAAGASRRVVIYGPPGTGKTFVARALAGELGLGFKRVSPHDTPKDLKNSASYASRQTLVFFDELEWVNYRPVFGEALRRMPKDVLVVGATNYPWKVQNILKEGFDCLIFMAEPDADVRAGILRHNIGLAADKMDVPRLSTLTEGYSAADIHHLCEWVAFGGQVTQERLEAAIGEYRTVQMGEWVQEAKANAAALDGAAFAPLLGWLKAR
jgi:SpoVK/Ycf46/Vps4 family AAA+-type ATPase